MSAVLLVFSLQCSSIAVIVVGHDCCSLTSAFERSLCPKLPLCQWVISRWFQNVSGGGYAASCPAVSILMVLIGDAACSPLLLWQLVSFTLLTCHGAAHSVVAAAVQTQEVAAELCKVMKTNGCIRELVLCNTGIKP